MLPPGTEIEDFSKASYKKVLRQLSDEGFPRALAKVVECAVEKMHAVRRDVHRLDEVIGERGGEQVLVREGYHVPEAFRCTGVEGAGTWAHMVDSLAVSPERDAIIFPDYKGASGGLDRPLRPTRFEGLAAQGTAPFLRDRMLSDPRVIRLFHDDRPLWEGVKAGKVRLYTQVIATTGPGQVQCSGLVEFSMKTKAPGVDEDAVIKAVEAAVTAIRP